MIRTFKHRGLQDLWETGSVAGITPAHAPRALRMLDALNAATKPKDMDLPGYKWHELKGNKAGTYAVTVSGNWRMTYRWDGVDAIVVNYEDYH